MKFKKKPIIVEAFRMGIDDIPDWFMNLVSSCDITLRSPTDDEDHSPFEHNDDTYCEIKTLEGVMTGNYGDWIIQGVSGVYPCKREIFNKTYDYVCDIAELRCSELEKIQNFERRKI